MNTIVTRLRPGQDLKDELINLCFEHAIEAGFVLTCVGSLTRATLRLAGAEHPTVFDAGPFEIVALSGTLSRNGVHLHVAIADKDGMVRGGHLLPGCSVYTTAEIVVGKLSEVTFVRRHDPETGYDELATEL